MMKIAFHNYLKMSHQPRTQRYSIYCCTRQRKAIYPQKKKNDFNRFTGLSKYGGQM